LNAPTLAGASATPPLSGSHQPSLTLANGHHYIIAMRAEEHWVCPEQSLWAAGVGDFFNRYQRGRLRLGERKWYFGRLGDDESAEQLGRTRRRQQRG